MEKELLTELISLIKGTAPELWRIAQQQVTVTIYQNVTWIGFFIVAIIVLTFVFMYARQRAKEDTFSDWDVALILAPIFIVFSIAAVLIFANDLIGYAMNPEYYAIKVLLRLVR